MILGAVISGGKSTRMAGQDKGLLTYQGQSFASLAFDKMQQQCDKVVISGNHNYDLPCSHVPDQFDQALGPLAGLISLLNWNKNQDHGAQWLATCPIDCPLMPDDYVQKLLKANGPAVLHDGERLQPLFAIWPKNTIYLLEEAFFQDGIRSMIEWVMMVGASIVSYPRINAYTNINTNDDYLGFMNAYDNE